MTLGFLKAALCALRYGRRGRHALQSIWHSPPRWASFAPKGRDASMMLDRFRSASEAYKMRMALSTSFHLGTVTLATSGLASIAQALSHDVGFLKNDGHSPEELSVRAAGHCKIGDRAASGDLREGPQACNSFSPLERSFGDRNPKSLALVGSLMGVNAVIFSLWFLTFRIERLLIWLYKPLERALHASWPALKKGRVYTLLGSIFSHQLPLHFLGNMVTLAFFAVPVCDVLGRANFIMLYCGAGLVANLFGSWHAYVHRPKAKGAWVPAPHGASGAIYAIVYANERMREQYPLLPWLEWDITRTALCTILAYEVIGALIQLRYGPVDMGPWKGKVAYASHILGVAVGAIYCEVISDAMRERLSGKSVKGLEHAEEDISVT